MKCYYEVLGVERDAEAAEIKTSYRKLALKWHPDKNLDKPELAKEQFQTVQNAYEVLSDPQERAWYDSHREQLLRGAGSSFNDDSLDLIPFFTPSCFKGFGDDAKGFYAVYKEVFKKLAAEEVDYLDDPEDIKNIPMFGRADTDYEKVHEFYSYWMSFSTSKSYVWLDKYDVREADNRRILKILEKENNKIRQKARKERNDEIRQLVSFVRRRDKRVLAHTKMLQEKAEENKLKAAKNRQDKLLQRRQELEEAKKRQSDIAVYSMDDFHQQLDQIEKHLAEEFGHSDDEFLTDSEEESNEKASTEKDVDKTPKENGSDAKEKNYSNNVSQGLYCTACNKMFKNVKSFENHENSKKHRENVANMQLDTELDFSGDEEEEDEQALASDSSVKDKLDDDDEDLDLLSEEDDYNVQQLAQSKKKKKKNKKQAVQSDHHSDVEETNLEDLNGGTRSRRARKAKAMEKVISKIKEKKKMASEVTEETVEGNLESEIVETDDSKELVDKENESTTNETDPKKLDTKKVNKSVKKFSQKQKDVIAANLDVADLDTAHCCAICKNEFPSKNKLFDHLKKTGHQVYLPTAQASAKVTVKASKKKSKK